MPARRLLGSVVTLIVVAACALSLVAAPCPAHAAFGWDVVFVARAHLATRDDIFRTEVGPAGQFGTGLTKFAPGSKLMLRRANGALVTLVDGANPTAATGFLIDVQAPDVSFDGTKIIFSGATTADPQSAQYGWRLYEIGVNGLGFRKLPIPDRAFTRVPNANPNQYNFGNAETYGWWNDLFPAYLADGRIVFASTRWPSRTHYDGRHTYNLHVVNPDGSGLRRITTDRGGFLHPTPLPDGRILTTRWWNNFNQPSDRGIYNRIDNQAGDHLLPDGTLVYSNTASPFVPALGRLAAGFEIRDAPNTWHLMTVDPDGAGLARFAFTPYAKWSLTDDSGVDTYTAAQPTIVFSATQMLVAYTSQQDSSMVHSTLKTGIRVAYPSAGLMYASIDDAIVGLGFDKAWNHNDKSAPYALHPAGLPDGTLLFSYTAGPTTGLPTSGNYVDRVTGRSFPLLGSDYQYTLHTARLDGSALTPLAASIGSADAMDAKPVVPRTGWTAKPDRFTTTPDDDPTLGNVPNSLPEYSFSARGPADIQTATIHNPNVYANPALDLPFINNSPPPGTIATAEVYVDSPQFTGAYCYGNYPNPCATFRSDVELRAVLWTRVPVTPAGAFTATVPADTPTFIVLRDHTGRVVSGWERGYISIAQGSAYARPGETVTCIGCHFGHVSGSVDPANAEARQGWTNVAPYARATASSHRVTSDPNDQPFVPTALNDRRGWIPVPTGGPRGPFQDNILGWMAAEGRSTGESVTLTWPIAITATRVRLVGPPPTGGDWGGFGQYSSPSPYYVTGATLRFYHRGVEVGPALPTGRIEPLAAGGTAVNLPTPRRIDRLTLTVDSIQGKWWWENVAALNEIEVVGMGAETRSNGCAAFSGATVGIQDISAIANSWGAQPGGAAWNPRYDLDNNGAIDIGDLQRAAAQWRLPCP